MIVKKRMHLRVEAIPAQSRMVDYSYLHDYNMDAYYNSDPATIRGYGPNKSGVGDMATIVHPSGTKEVERSDEVWIQGLGPRADQSLDLWVIPSKKGMKKGKKMANWEMDVSSTLPLKPEPISQ